MTHPKAAPKHCVDARLLSLDQVAQYFGITTAVLVRMMPILKKNGFPNALPLFELWDRKVLDLWLDKVGGITQDRLSFHPPEKSIIGSRFAPVLRKRHVVANAKSDPNGYTVAQAMDNYANWFRTHGRDVKKVHYYANSYILPYFGHRVVSELTPPEIRAWHEGLATSPRSRYRGFGKPRMYYPPPQTDEEKRKRRQSANSFLTMLKAALNLAFREGLVPSDAPWRPVLAYKGAEIAKVSHLSIEQCRILIPILPVDFRDLVRGALYTGARLMELARMTADDFEPLSGSIHIPPAKTLRARHVALSDEGAAFFRTKTENLKPKDLIFHRADGHAWRAPDPAYRLKVPCQMAGLPHVTFHAFRHTYASMLVLAGTPIAVVAKNLGHRNTEICERYYLHLTESYVATEIRAHTPPLVVG